VTPPRLNFYAMLCGMCSMLVPVATSQPASVTGIETKNIRVEFNTLMHSRIVAKFDGRATPARIKENFEIFDFELSPDDADALTELDKGEKGRTGPNPDEFDYIPD